MQLLLVASAPFFLKYSSAIHFNFFLLQFKDNVVPRNWGCAVVGCWLLVVAATAENNRVEKQRQDEPVGNTNSDTRYGWCMCRVTIY